MSNKFNQAATATATQSLCGKCKCAYTKGHVCEPEMQYIPKFGGMRWN